MADREANGRAEVEMPTASDAAGLFADVTLPEGASAADAEILTVAALNEEIAETIERRVDLEGRFLVGDVTDVAEANGNLHFDLSFESASVHCLLLDYRRGRVGTEPAADAQVAVAGSLSYYEERGSCTVFVTDCYHIGDSDYAAIYRENREILAGDGLLANERKQPLPDLPGTVGVVTSADSDARVDVVTTILDRFPTVDVVVSDARVQGADALQELMSGVNDLDTNAAVDVVVLTRGGGADQTLRVFNETPLCRVIADTDTPIVVAVGHEDDRTLAGEVADHRAMTPTHAGEVVVPERAWLADRIEYLEVRLGDAVTRAVTSRKETLAVDLDGAYVDRVISRLERRHEDLTRVAGETVSAGVASLESNLETAAVRFVDAELAAYSSDLDGAAYHRTETRLQSLQSDLERAFQFRKQAHEHEAAVDERVDALRRRYILALAILFAFVLGLGLLLVILFLL